MAHELMTTPNQRHRLTRPNEVLSFRPPSVFSKVRSELIERVLGLLLLRRETGGEPFGKRRAVAV